MRNMRTSCLLMWRRGTALPDLEPDIQAISETHAGRNTQEAHASSDETEYSTD